MESLLSEVTIRKSIRKYFVDTLQTGLSIPVYFDKIERLPASVSEWVSVQFDTIDFAVMASAYIQIYCFTREDLDFTKLALLRDNVYENLIDLNQTDGMKRIPMYYSDWITPVGWAVFQPQNDLAVVQLDDDTNCKVLPLLMRFGSK